MDMGRTRGEERVSERKKGGGTGVLTAIVAEMYMNQR